MTAPSSLFLGGPQSTLTLLGGRRCSALDQLPSLPLVLARWWGTVATLLSWLPRASQSERPQTFLGARAPGLLSTFTVRRFLDNGYLDDHVHLLLR